MLAINSIKTRKCNKLKQFNVITSNAKHYCFIFSTYLSSLFKHFVPSVNNKSELMLMRRARAYDNFCSQVILVYLHPFRRNSLFCSQRSPKITQNQYF